MTDIGKRTQRLIAGLKEKRGNQVKVVYKDGTEIMSGFEAVIAAAISDEGRQILRVECPPGSGALESLINAMLTEVPVNFSDIPELDE